MLALLYVAVMAAAALLAAAALWIPALALAALGFILAGRYELRWVADHTRLTSHKPRAVPRR